MIDKNYPRETWIPSTNRSPNRRAEVVMGAMVGMSVTRVRIPVKTATDSGTKPAESSDFKNAT